MKLVRNRLGQPVAAPSESPMYEGRFGCVNCQAVMDCTEHDFKIEEYHASADAELRCPECGHVNWIDPFALPVKVRRKLFGDCRQRLIDEGEVFMQEADQAFERSVEEYDLFAGEEQEDDDE